MCVAEQKFIDLNTSIEDNEIDVAVGGDVQVIRCGLRHVGGFVEAARKSLLAALCETFAVTNDGTKHMRTRELLMIYYLERRREKM